MTTEEYLQKSRLSNGLDAIGSRIFLLLICLGWFILLWGVRLPALIAGAGLYLFVMILRRTGRDRRLKQKEKRLRARIGAELHLEALSMEKAHKAHFEIALLLSERYALKLNRTLDEGVLCEYGNEVILVALGRMHEKARASGGDILAFQRACRDTYAIRGVLCLPCSVSPEARMQALAQPKITLIEREDVLNMLGRVYPATDAQLTTLGKRRKECAGLSTWRARILDPTRAPKYAAYGGLLLLLYLLTGLAYYPFPGILLFILSAICRCNKKKSCLL